MSRNLMNNDREIFEVIQKETRRQTEKIELIASENYVSQSVLEAMGSVLTNKYAEGYPGKRYYGGCEYVDEAERLARDRCKALFGCEYVNVQPHSGSQANMEAYFAVASPGDTIMGLDLSCGGHLTHGSPVNFSGRYFKVIPYGVSRETGLIDMDNVEKLAKEHRPRIIVAGASAYPRFIDFERFRKIADEVGAFFIVDMAHIAGLIAAGVHPSCIEHAHIVTSTTHKTLRGPRGGLILAKEAVKKEISKMVFPGMQGGPFMHIIAAKAVAFKEALEPEFKKYARQVVTNASVLAKELMNRGYTLTTGGTDNHLMVMDLRPFKISGKLAEETLDRVNITVSKSTIPYDTARPTDPSGIRIGTPAVTTRGMKEEDMKKIADFIDRAFKNIEDQAYLAKLADEVRSFATAFPIFAW